MKIAALDIGRRKTGIGWVDLDTKIILPGEIIRHKTEIDFLEQILKFISNKHIEKVIVGVPNYPDPTSLQSYQYQLGQILSREIVVEYIDESLTTLEARELLSEHNIQTNNEDIEAAMIILERYMGNS